MIGLREYLDLSQWDAEQSWARILQRTPAAAGQRQNAFLPVETLLCYGLFLIMNPHRFGGRNIAQAPYPLHQLALVFRRSPRSILEKMFNLDGTRPHRAVHEWQLFARLQDDLSLYTELYRRILRAARAADLEHEDLGDFLGLEEGGRLVLLGQEEVPAPELEAGIQDQLAEEQERLEASEPETERLLISRARVGQHIFARFVLERCGEACVFCGMAPRSLLDEGLLVASHIKPWRVSLPRERLDPQNGLAACPTHDAAFDSGLITVEDDLTVSLSMRLRASIATDPGMADHFGGQGLRAQLPLLPTARPHRVYLRWHRGNVYGA